jgi:PHD/YefM family antitoxin component YafN of YafNO toxin-antitoxin module
MRSEQLISIGKFTDNVGEFIDELNTTHTPLILIQNDAPVAVVQNVKEYQKLLNALCMLKLMIQGEKDIQEGKGRKQADVFTDINRTLELKSEQTISGNLDAHCRTRFDRHS